MRKLAILVLLAACKSKPAPNLEPVASTVDAQPSASSAPAADASVANAPTAHAPAARPATEEEKKNFAEYVAAIGRGRKATIAKDYAAAAHAFDEALAVRPNDARALAEKGYAELGAKSFHRARTDLEAASATTDEALGTQVWFNLGLVDEALKNDADALVDFWFANQLHPSAAAAGRIAGRAVCPVRVNGARIAATHASSWLEVAREMHKLGNEPIRESTPKTEADAKKELLASDTPLIVPGKGTFHFVRVGDMTSAFVRFTQVVQESGADFWLYPQVGAQSSSGMGVDTPEPTLTIDRVGRWVHVSAGEQTFTFFYFCSESDASYDVFQCTGDPKEVQVGPSGGHPLGPVEYTEFFFDPDAHAQVLTLEDHASGRFSSISDGGKGTSVRADGDGIELDGLGCNLRLLGGDGGPPR